MPSVATTLRRDPGAPLVGGSALGPVLADLAAGRLIVLVDELSSDCGGSLVLAAESAGTAAMAFMVRHSSGFVCAALPAPEADRLRLPPMPARDLPARAPAYGVSVDAVDGVTTGISAADRARTVRLLASPATRPDDLTRPGHVIPIRTHPGGPGSRRGPGEAASELARLAGRAPVGVLAAIVDPQDPRRMATSAEARGFAADHALAVTSLEELSEYLAHGTARRASG